MSQPYDGDDYDYDERDDDRDYDNGYSHSDQVWADRSDCANELYERGVIDETQRAEMRMGA